MRYFVARSLSLVFATFALTSLTFASSAWAQKRSLIGAAVYYSTEKAQQDQAKAQATTTIFNVSLGADLGDGIYLGAKYFQHEVAYGSDDSDADLALTGLGASLGYLHKSGFMLIGSYLLDVKKKFPNASPSVTLTGDKGSIVDIGYMVDMNSWAFGPQITMASLEYSESKAQGQDAVDLSGTYKDETTYPYIAFYVYF